MIKLISSYDKTISLADEGKASDVDCLDFSKAFNTNFPHNSPEETACSWLMQVHSSLDKMIRRLDSES